MLIDRSHGRWVVVTSVAFLASTGLYIWYARVWPGGPTGRTWPGMAFGVAATAAMIFAGLLSGRKQTVALRAGSLSWWLKGHIWLGLLSVPLVCFHAAFRWGGLLEGVLWVAFLAVIVSGVVGLVLQNLLPRVMKLQLPDEVIPDQLERVCTRLQKEADDHVLAACGNDALVNALDGELDGELAARATAIADPDSWFAEFYLRTVRPFLTAKFQARSPLASSQQAQIEFDRTRSTLPDRLHALADQLEACCAYRRQLALQDRLYRWLHGWLRIHIPVSIALLVFGLLHIVTALYY